MSIKEEIQFFHRFDPDAYLTMLRQEFAATEHPEQHDAYLIDDLPFYKPKLAIDYVFILSFNYAPLSSLLIEALATHPELVPDYAIVRWLIEQDVLLEDTMGTLRKMLEESGG